MSVSDFSSSGTVTFFLFGVAGARRYFLYSFLDSAHFFRLFFMRRGSLASFLIVYACVRSDAEGIQIGGGRNYPHSRNPGGWGERHYTLGPPVGAPGVCPRRF